MIFYLVLLLSTISLAFLSQFSEEKMRFNLCLAAILILGAVASFRGYVGTDTYSYHLQFDQIQTTDFFSDVGLVTEPAFVLLGKWVDFLGGNSFGYVSLIGILQTILVVLIIRRLENPAYFLIYYIATLYINLHYNILREGTALLFIMLALTRIKEGGVLFFVFLFSSIFFHYSSFLFVPYIILYKQIKEEKYVYVGILLILLLVASYAALSILGEYLQLRASAYESEEVLLPSIGLGFTLQIFLYTFLCVCLVKDNMLETAFFAMPFIVIKVLSLRYPLLVRIEVFFQVSFLIFLTKDIINDWQGELSKIVLAILCLQNVFGVVTNLEGGDNLYYTDEAHNNSPYVPYHTMVDITR